MAPAAHDHEVSTADTTERPADTFSMSDVEAPALVLIGSRDEPQRVGEVALLDGLMPGKRRSFGRATTASDGIYPLSLSRLRPGSREPTGPLHSVQVSRRQLLLSMNTERVITIAHSGRGVLRVNERECADAALQLGDVISVDNKFTLLFTSRPRAWGRDEGACRYGEAFPFGHADPFGIVGESPATWALREKIARVGGRPGHVLVLGPSGAGKEFVVRAVHERSRPAGAPLISRDASTLRESTINEELFGTAPDYPRPGDAAQPGLLEQSDGGTLYLDELGELSNKVQAQLRRVLDHGEYSRIGEARVRISDTRVVGTTNRALVSLRDDLLGRFVHRVVVPGFGERREDIPLLARHTLRAIASEDPSIQARFFDDDEPRVGQRLTVTFMTAKFTTHMWQLQELLWRALDQSAGDTLEPPSLLWQLSQQQQPQRRSQTPETTASGMPPSTQFDSATGLSRARVVEALERTGGVRERAWRELGLSSRYQLRRLMRQFGLLGL